jgi:hypothetical protein
MAARLRSASLAAATICSYCATRSVGSAGSVAFLRLNAHGVATHHSPSSRIAIT